MRNVLSLMLMGLIFAGCQSAGCQSTRTMYYNAWEKLGYAKRERLVDNVKAAQAEQVQAKDQFQDALEQFRSVVNFDGGDLEKLYNQLDKSYQRSVSQADAVRSKIASVKHVAEALFEEWKGEIKQIEGDPSLRRQSEQLYDKTHRSYGEMIDRMDAAASTMDPVLQKFKNRVLFLKHNLNAQAIASLKGTELELGSDIQNLLSEMEKSIQEADSFISQMQGK